MTQTIARPNWQETPEGWRRVPQRHRPLPRDIIRAVAEKHGLKLSDIIGDSRVQHIAKARCEAYHSVKKHTSLSLPAIGKHFGGRHHTTIMSGIRRWDEYWSKQ